MTLRRLLVALSFIALLTAAAIGLAFMVGVDGEGWGGTNESTAVASPLQFVVDREYEVGETVAIRLRNRSAVSFVYNPFYAACDLEYLDATGRAFLIPPGTHCDLQTHDAVAPGQTVTLFRWDLSECTEDRWGCVQSRSLGPGRYTIKGRFSRRKESNRRFVEVGERRTAAIEATFRIVDRLPGDP